MFLMDLESLKIKIARSENLPVLPQIVSQVIKVADDPDGSPKALEKIIERDAAISAKILRVANSSFYGLNQVNSIGRALGVLGMNTVRSLVVAIAYQQIISGRTQSQYFDKVAFWQHSLAVATTARVLGKLRSPGHTEELYSAGMMHDIGLLVMDRFCPDQLDQAIKYSRDEQIPLHQAEATVLGFDHTLVGGLLAEKWGLQGLMRNAIVFHHEPVMDDQCFESTCLIAVANGMAHQSGFTNNGGAPSPEIDATAFTVLELPDEQLTIISTVVSAEIQKAQEAYQIK